MTTTTPRRRARPRRSLHEGAAADTLGRCHGLVRGGGALILCLPPTGRAVRRPELAVYPYASADVGKRFWRRLEQHLARLDTTPPAEPLVPPPEVSLGSAEQARVVERLVQAFTGGTPWLVALVAERGRGKSSAFGLALAAARVKRPALRALVTAPHEDAAEELFRFAARDAGLRFVTPSRLLEASSDASSGPDVIVVAMRALRPALRRLLEH